MTEQFQYVSGVDFLHVINVVFQEIARRGSNELVTAEGLAEQLDIPEQHISKALDHAVGFGIAARHGQPGAYYFGQASGWETRTNTETINVDEVPNRRAAIVFMHPEETEIEFSESGCLELTDEFNGVIFTPTVVDKLRRFLGISEGR